MNIFDALVGQNYELNLGDFDSAETLASFAAGRNWLLRRHDNLDLNIPAFELKETLEEIADNSDGECFVEIYLDGSFWEHSAGQDEVGYGWEDYCDRLNINPKTGTIDQSLQPNDMVSK